MNPYALDLSLEVVEGSVHNLGDLTLWCRLRANTHNPLQPRPQMSAFHRSNAVWTPVADEPDVSPDAVADIVAELRRLRWPGRELEASARPMPDRRVAGCATAGRAGWA